MSAKDESAVVLDDVLTLCAISVIACMLATMLHEALGHAAVAILTLHVSGTLTTVAWSSERGSRLVLAGGTLVNLATALILWLLLRVARDASASLRFFVWVTMTFSLFSGTGYFFYSGVTDFGDWARVIDGLHPHWLWRVGLIVVGAASYYLSMRIVGSTLVRSMGVSLEDVARFRRFTVVPYVSALLIEVCAGWLNPFGLKYVLLSAAAATGGANCALLWMRHYLSKNITPGPRREPLVRSYAWIVAAVFLSAIFIGILGPGVHLPR
jgi:hypothetical protein